ncbi:hypothetical protein LWI28_018621 [Acer negundo]|uniref:Uncharacterized protein n=1 Tax=Acer negundo TaxID=4023 RepID=A0AAD5IFS7_ACENE|nr:hypothetical protein LWI28_018621 [Acer negundo]
MFSLWRNMTFPAPTFAEIGHCYSLCFHKSGGDGWWALTCCDKQDGEPLITGLSSSNKKWKKIWFVMESDYGKDLRLGGRRQSVRSVFNIPAAWERVPLESFSQAKRDHISKAWSVLQTRRHANYLLDDWRLHELSFIPILSED